MNPDTAFLVYSLSISYDSGVDGHIVVFRGLEFFPQIWKIWVIISWNVFSAIICFLLVLGILWHESHTFCYFMGFWVSANVFIISFPCFLGWITYIDPSSYSLTCFLVCWAYPRNLPVADIVILVLKLPFSSYYNFYFSSVNSCLFNLIEHIYNKRIKIPSTNSSIQSISGLFSVECLSP